MSAASPLSLPIARLRALGARVGHLPEHNPSKHALKPWIGLVVTLPDGQRHVFSRPGHAYASVVQGLDQLSERLEESR